MAPNGSTPDGPATAGSAGSGMASDEKNEPGNATDAVGGSERAAVSTFRSVVSADEMGRKLRRMAHEVLESNKGAQNLVVLGIPTRGVPLARRLTTLMSEVEGQPIPLGYLDITLYRDDLRRRPTRALEPTSIPRGGIDDKVVVLVDDVLYSGRTIRAALDALNDIGRPRAVRLAVLVDRGHRELPIRADIVGKNLPTSRSEQVRVALAEIDGFDEVRIAGGDA